MHGIDLNGLEHMASTAGRCLWSSGRHDCRYMDIVKNIRAVVHGHRTIPLMVELGNVFFIDTSGWQPGCHFTFLNLATLQSSRGPGCEIGTMNTSRRNR